MSKSLFTSYRPTNEIACFKVHVTWRYMYDDTKIKCISVPIIVYKLYADQSEWRYMYDDTKKTAVVSKSLFTSYMLTNHSA